MFSHNCFTKSKKYIESLYENYIRIRKYRNLGCHEKLLDELHNTLAHDSTAYLQKKLPSQEKETSKERNWGLKENDAKKNDGSRSFIIKLLIMAPDHCFVWFDWFVYKMELIHFHKKGFRNNFR